MAVRTALRLVATALAPAAVQAESWAVIAAGSNGFMNYRHQADACHAYQIMKKGIPEDRIILLAYDDIANSDENPFKGKLFNKPDPQGHGIDVYDGCKIDYAVAEVTPDTFSQVLLGTGNGKVLGSSADDDVFVFFSDHGAPGLIAFPDDELHKQRLHQILATMKQKGMFKRLVFYLESCESGSMFQGLNVPGVYALSASNPSESSWGAYCEGNETVVDGQDIGACLGDLFSVSWMEDTDGEGGSKETLEAQFRIVKRATSKSHVLQWGDLSFVNEDLSDFFGAGRRAAGVAGAAGLPADGSAVLDSDSQRMVQSAVSAREVDLNRLYGAYRRAPDFARRGAAAAALQAELSKQSAAEDAYRRFVERVFPGDEAKQQELFRARAAPDHPACELRAHAALREGCKDLFDANSGFALQFHQVVVNACAAAASGLSADPVEAANWVCVTSAREPSRAAPALVV